jgi:microcystin-dependent protein
MAQPYVGEIRMFAGNFNPSGWEFCWGQLLPISENDVLFQLIGTTYGGDGQTTFALPDFRARTPVHFGGTYQLAELGGVEQVTLTTNQIPSHTHTLLATTDLASTSTPQNNVPAGPNAPNINAYGTDDPLLAMNNGHIGIIGGNQPHENMQPYLVINFIISLFGIFPHQ